RLVVPLQHLLATPFQNWTRKSSELLGMVTFEVDYRAPLEAMRRAAGEIVTRQKEWDGRFWNLVVLDAGPTTMRIRILASAADSTSAWNLRCAVREEMLVWLQRHHPDALPRLRVAPPEAAAPAAVDTEPA
ncbi:MAG: mechanosensitive ion channel family protein, partial [Myxococcota bacterium]|nr:mechanosensitive ion channel family protein [Myxococcota bacterium]